MAAVSSGIYIVTVHISFNTVHDGVTIPLPLHVLKSSTSLVDFLGVQMYCSTAGRCIAMVRDKTIFIIYTGFIFSLSLTQCYTGTNA